MNKLKSTLVIAALIASALPAMAQRQRTSPHDTLSAKIDGNRVTIVYGRPYSANPKNKEEIRKIWGGLVPYGKIWRVGADEATLLITQQPIDLGGTTVPAGTYTLFMLPDETGASKLLVNKQVGQWGVDPYDEKQELARIDLKKEAIEKQVDQFTMAVDKNPSGGGVIKLTWEKTQFSVPFTVKK
jgi:hypothetical protein